MLITKEKSVIESPGEFIPPEKINRFLSAGQYLNVACDYFKVLDKTLGTYGGHKLCEYLDAIAPCRRQAWQPISDLLTAVQEYAKPLLGESIAKQAAEDIDRSPVVLTANHHGIMYFSQDFQGSMIFSLNRKPKQGGLRTVPIFACGTIPLDNITYPLGMLCYRTGDGKVSHIPGKIPVFSNKMRRQMVCFAKPFDRSMIARAQRRAKKLVAERRLCATLDRPIQTLLGNDYCKSSTIDLPGYSQQAVVLNQAIWNRIFNFRQHVPELVTLELEKISTRLIELDLENTDSLLHCVLFDAELRENIFKELDGKRACWKAKELLERLHADRSREKPTSAAGGCGTMLFWGLDSGGRRFPLYLKTNSTKTEKLSGIDVRGTIFEMPFSVNSIAAGLAGKRIVPSIFTSMLVVSLARGVVCAGGYFQCDYLPAIQRGLTKALKSTGGYDVAARYIANISTDTYLSGMIAVMSRVGANSLIPAGPVEILAAGGLDETDAARMQSMTIKDAHLSALSETLQDLPAEVIGTFPPNWKGNLSADLARLLDGRVVTK